MKKKRKGAKIRLLGTSVGRAIFFAGYLFGDQLDDDDIFFMAEQIWAIEHGLA